MTVKRYLFIYFNDDDCLQMEANADDGWRGNDIFARWNEEEDEVIRQYVDPLPPLSLNNFVFYFSFAC